MTTIPTSGPVTGPATGPERAPGPLRMTPGRRVALLLGVPIVLTLIGWTGFGFVSGFGTASFPVSATIPLQSGRLVASLDGADVTLHEDLAGGSTARLVGKVQYSLVRPGFTVAGTDVNLHCRLFTGNCGLAANLDVPAHTAVDLTTGGGNMQLSGIQNDLTLNTGGGDVSVSGVGGSTDLSTGGGNISASDLVGNVMFRTSGGDVSVNDLLASQVKLDTGGGNISLVFAKVPTSLEIHSSGGDISVVLPHSATRYAITTDLGGGNYSASVPTNSASGNTINIGSGGGNVSITEAS